MKTLKNYPAFYFILLIFNVALISCKSDCKKCPEEITATQRPKIKTAPTSYTIPGEDALFLRLSEVESTDGVSEIEDCDTHLSWPNNVGLATLAATLNPATVKSFSALPLSLRPRSGCNNYITGMRILFGAESGFAGTQIKLLYRPVIFCRKSISQGPNGERFGNYAMTEGPCYAYNGSTLAIATHSNDFISTYTAQIQVCQTGTVFSTHNNRTDIAGDVTSVIFSTQEFLALIQDNSTSTTTVNCIKLWNAIREVSDTHDNSYFKHCLLISTDAPDDEPHPLYSYKGKYANLSHLCPPSCNGDDFTFRLKN